MACYLIDTDDGLNFVPGDPEISFACPREAKITADKVLGAMLQDVLPDGPRRVLRATVRDNTGREVYEATVTFAGDWKGPLAA